MKRILFIILILLVLSACSGTESEIVSVTATSAPTLTATNATTSTPEPTLTATSNPTDTPEPTSEPTAVLTQLPTKPPEPFMHTSRIGQSANGTEMTVTKLGRGKRAVLLVGGLHAGFSPGSVALMEQVVDYYTQNEQAVPADIVLYVVVNANPDSVLGEVGAVNGRLNGNGVDLNRNWDCDWTADAQWRGQPVNGGSAPFSEPEAQALQDLIIYGLLPEAVIVYDAAGGVVVPGVCDNYSLSEDLAAHYAEAAGYTMSGIGGSTVTGDLTDWLNSQGIPAIAPLLSTYTDMDWEQNLAGIEAVLDYVVSQEAVSANSKPTPTVVPQPTLPLSQEFPGTMTIDLNAGSDLGLPYLEISSETQTGSVSKIEYHPAVTEAEHWAEITPAYTEIALAGDVPATIYVYPLPEDLDILPDTYPDRVRRLQTLLSERPDLAAKPGIPSMSNVGSLISSQEKYVSFSSGSGVRLVVYRGSHATYRITNDSLVYTFQGLTDNGRYVIVVDVSLDQADLPNSSVGEGGGGYQDTYPTVVAQLNAVPNHSFTPDLSLIDEMVSSIKFVSELTRSTTTTAELETPISVQEYDALAALYRNLDGENWESHDQWLQTENYCAWQGVTCTKGRVTDLTLIEFDLSGDIPPEIGDLTDLRILRLGYNNLQSLPPEIGNLTNLTVLDLRDNAISYLPPEIGNLVNLKKLILHRNSLSVLPPEIGNLTNLTELNLVLNSLSVLPPEIGNLTSLVSLSLINNNALYDLPPEIGNLKNLNYLNLDGNELSSLPPEIGNLMNMSELGLMRNNLSSIPPEIGNLDNLFTLNLTGNDLSNLPPEIGNAQNLSYLFLEGNNLSIVPPEICHAFSEPKRIVPESLCSP